MFSLGAMSAGGAGGLASIGTADADTLRATIAQPWNAIIFSVFAIALFWHAKLGLQVVIEDYIHKPGTKGALIGLLNLVCFVLAAAGVFFIVRLALGSAPLPAGLGV